MRKHLAACLALAALAAAADAATYTSTEGARVVVSRSVSSGDTLAVATNAGDTIKFDGSVADLATDRFRIAYTSGCPSLVSDDVCDGSLTFDAAGTVRIGIQSIDNDCVEATSLTLTWTSGDDTTDDTYNFGDDDGRSEFWLSLFPMDTNACP